MTQPVQSKKIRQILLFLLLLSGVTALGGQCMRIETLWLKIVLLLLCNLTNGALALVFLHLGGMRVLIRPKEPWQYLVGLAIAGALIAALVVLPELFGGSLFGGRIGMAWSVWYNVWNDLLIIGPVEELMFREYLQGSLVALFPKRGWVGVLIASLLFGLWHLINGTLTQVLFATGIGLVFGFARYRIRSCTYLSVAMAHGLYDSIGYLSRLFL